MNHSIDPLLPGASAAPEVEHKTSSLSPLLLALGRGFTLAGWIAIIIVNGIYGVTIAWGAGPVVDFVVMGLAGFLFVALFDGLLSLLWKLLGFLLPRLGLGRLNAAVQAVPGALLGRLLGILLMTFGNLLWPDSVFQHATLLLPGKIVVMAAAVGGALFAAARVSRRPAWRAAGSALAIAPLLAAFVWLFAPGTDDYLARPVAINPAIPALEIDNPGLPGPFAVGSLSYGSGDSHRRPEFGVGAALTTTVVDGSAIFPGYEGIVGDYHTWYNGFDFTRLPLNGLVWYPEGEGPFPLVLIVHGNHAMTQPSDPGYAYLGEHLASRGMIAVSVDENFLNGFGLADPEQAEMPLRAWLLLKHLAQWRDWNATPGNPFYGRVDVERVGLIGHSRGGEAVAHAAEMNVRPIGRVGTVTERGEFGFGIRGVVALAPCDNRYKPAGASLRLRNADYLLLSGGHDGDMYYLDGLGQYARTTFSENPDGFKALAYLYRGNHGNFNTVWGDADQGALESLLLNRKPLLPAEEQQQAAKVLITGFLEASLNDRDEYRALFYQPVAARDWLPDDLVVTQYLDAGFVPIDTNERGLPAELEVTGGQATTTGMTAWRVAKRTLRDGSTTVNNRGLLLEWAAGSDTPTYSLALPAGAAAGWALSPDHALSFTLGSRMDVGAPGGVVVELETAGGATARLPLDQFGPLQPALPARFTKADWIARLPDYALAPGAAVEYVDQTYDLPLSAFVAAAPGFDPAQLTAVRFLFDSAAGGRLMLDDVGFRTP
jgi:dienelactone hydrolase